MELRVRACVDHAQGRGESLTRNRKGKEVSGVGWRWALLRERVWTAAVMCT